jgi:acyl-CoA synthetase (NDP forming)
MTSSDSTAAPATRDEALSFLARAALQGRRAFSEPEAKQVLAAFGVAVPRGFVLEAGSSQDPAARLAALAPPWVAKLVSPQPLHKSDVGGVMLGLHDAAAVRQALAQLEQRAPAAGVPVSGLLVEEMSAPGVELVIGGMHDERFGPVLMFGLGGVHVEIFEDVAFRVCPIDAADAADMIEQLRGKALLRGARGRVPVDERALVQLLLRIGGADGLLCASGGAIAELDINPVIAAGSSLTACDARITLREPAAPREAQPERPDNAALLARFQPLFEPRVIAVVGASATGSNLGNEFIRQCRALGCRARIVPIHPQAAEVEGLPAVRSIAEIGEVVDYAYVGIGAEQVQGFIDQAAGKVRFAQVISSGFGEVSGGRALEERLAQAAGAAGVRILGPNCLGIYSPRAGIAFQGDSPREPGTIGIVSQSGGLAVDMLLRGGVRGLRFSALATLGNSVDVGPAELLDYFLADPHTRAIGLYLEDVKRGQQLFEALRGARQTKPVCVLLGGQTSQGQQAAASHTGSLATPLALWQGLARQTGAFIADTLEQFLDTLLAFQSLVPRRDRPTRHCVLFGNGGGTSVLAADAFGRRGLEVRPLPAAALERLEALKLSAGSSVLNPIDTPAATLRQEQGGVAERILDIVAEHGAPDAIVVHINLPVFVKSTNQSVDVVGNMVGAITRVAARHPGGLHFALVLRSDGSSLCDERKRAFRSVAAAAGIPVFDELTNAADALAALAAHESFLARGVAAGARA